MPSTTTSSVSTANGKGKSAATSGSPISSLPFLPRRRTLSNLFNQFTSSSNKDKESNSNTPNKKDNKSSLQFTSKAEQSSTSVADSPRNSTTSMHVQQLQQPPPQGWSTSAALPTPPASSTTSGYYSNPFASAFYSDSQACSPRPSSPRLKKKDSYLALNIPPTPGVGTSSSAGAPSLAYTENGNRPLKGQDEDYILPSPITENDADADDEQELRPTHPYHRHGFHALSSTSPLYKTPHESSLNGIAAQPISSTSAFLSSLTSSAPTLSTQRASHATLSTLLPPILFLCVSFMISLTIMFYMVSTIPLTIPHNISEIKLQTVALRDYSRKGLSEGLHVSAVLSALFVFKQAFSVPGSILVNILFGSLYGTYAATVCACIFTGVGSVLAYYMARLCAPLVERFFPRALSTTRSALLSGSSSDLFSYLLLARLFPLLPYSALNIACGVLKVPVKPYFTTLVLGSFPYNFVTTQLGDLLGSLANSAESGNINAIWTWDLIFKLAVASILSAAPVIFKEQLKGIIGGSSEANKETIISSEENLPLAPLSANTDYIEPEADLYDNYAAASYGQDRNAPLLRRDRTDSSASEVLFAPALELFDGSSSGRGSNSSSASHKKKWSFSWKSLRRSLNSSNNESACSASEYSLNSADTSSFASHTTARTSLDEEAGDTDEEISRIV
ncbi:hypothetical protein P389DRAFT_14731 [Cystobasidium minutum MCA 4210]|uniref:uncharacterized protein n=1 Tax=Cystobasidium minutum MCA 4210 TaxID=1397322 RepID=UPI0034CF71F5|eukprot:jgi/Rhomi1/14731/CE14730_2403